MQEPFDLELGNITYSVFPEEEDIYAIFKEGTEYIKIQKDNDEHWLKLDNDTELPLFTEDEEVNRIGRAIATYKESDI
jgi:hypothetical protein